MTTSTSTFLPSASAPPAPAPSVPPDPRPAPPDAAAHPGARPAIAPRKGPSDFAAVPKHWFGGFAVPSHLVNGINLLFPAGERFFVRSVYHYLDRIGDPKLAAAVRGFGGQEGRHARSHEDFFATLRAQGYEIDRFLRFYTWVSYNLTERFAPPALRLACTAAAEHYTAIMAAGTAGDVPLQLAHPALRQLLYWHAAEEIEHKSVAYDVLQQVNPSYALRVAGLAVATTMLTSMWMIATVALLRQDDISLRGAIASMRKLRAQRGGPPGGLSPALPPTGHGSPSGPATKTRDDEVLGTESFATRIGQRVFLRGIRKYLARDFHPDQEDNYHLAAQLLARAEAARLEWVALQAAGSGTVAP